MVKIWGLGPLPSEAQVLVGGEAMREPNVKAHPFREIVLDALKSAQSQGESGPVAMARATKAIVEAHPNIMLGDAFTIVWTIWEA